MSDKFRDAATDALDAFHDFGHWLIAAALFGGAAFIVVRTFMTP